MNPKTNASALGSICMENVICKKQLLSPKKYISKAKPVPSSSCFHFKIPFTDQEHLWV